MEHSEPNHAPAPAAIENVVREPANRGPVNAVVHFGMKVGIEANSAQRITHSGDQICPEPAGALLLPLV